MRNRLIELLNYTPCKAEYCAALDGGRCGDLDKLDRCQIEAITDYLLANGVIVLPCKVGDVVYVIKYCRCGSTDPYKAGHCLRKVTKTTPKVLAQKMELQKGRKLKWDWGGKTYHTYEDIGTICHRVYEKPFNLNMLTSIGKTVFLTKEEAERALKGGTE